MRPPRGNQASLASGFSFSCFCLFQNVRTWIFISPCLLTQQVAYQVHSFFTWLLPVTLVPELDLCGDPRALCEATSYHTGRELPPTAARLLPGFAVSDTAAARNLVFTRFLSVALCSGGVASSRQSRPRVSLWPVSGPPQRTGRPLSSGPCRQMGCSTLGFVQLIEVTWLLVKSEFAFVLC